VPSLPVPEDRSDGNTSVSQSPGFEACTFRVADGLFSDGWSSFQPAQVDQYSGGAHSFGAPNGDTSPAPSTGLRLDS
jgi:hypothetical protein